MGRGSSKMFGYAVFIVDALIINVTSLGYFNFCCVLRIRRFCLGTQEL